jgi:hypothetical protein
MTSETGKNRHGWRRAVTGGVASGALVFGLMAGVTGPMALAEPADPTTETEAPATPQPTGDVLAVIAEKYMQGAGGGQISNFIKESLQLRALGFRPSKANLADLQAGLDYLPNQVRLLEALQNTVAYQRNLRARSEAAVMPQQGFNMGMNQPPPGVPADPGDPNSGVYLAPGGGINQPIG